MKIELTRNFRMICVEWFNVINIVNNALHKIVIV